MEDFRFYDNMPSMTSFKKGSKIVAAQVLSSEQLVAFVATHPRKNVYQVEGHGEGFQKLLADVPNLVNTVRFWWVDISPGDIIIIPIISGDYLLLHVGE